MNMRWTLQCIRTKIPVYSSIQQSPCIHMYICVFFRLNTASAIGGYRITFFSNGVFVDVMLHSVFKDIVYEATFVWLFCVMVLLNHTYTKFIIVSLKIGCAKNLKNMKHNFLAITYVCFWQRRCVYTHLLCQQQTCVYFSDFK